MRLTDLPPLPVDPDDPTVAGGVALLFSGGSDSTLAACRLAEVFPVVHLVTYQRVGFIEKIATERIERMRARFPRVRFVQHKVPYEAFYAEVEGHRRLRDALRYGQLTGVPCGPCKVSMHWRNLVFCQEHGIAWAADGAATGNEWFAEQNPRILLDPLRDLYADYGVTLLHPVFYEGLSTDGALFELGVTDTPTVKRTREDKQVVCSQQIMLAMYMRKYLHNHTFDEYEATSRAYLEGKLEHVRKLLDEDSAAGARRTRIRKLLERG